MATLKESLINEIHDINDDRVLKSIQNLIHTVEDATKYIQTNMSRKPLLKKQERNIKKEIFIPSCRKKGFLPAPARIACSRKRPACGIGSKASVKITSTT